MERCMFLLPMGIVLSRVPVELPKAAIF